MSKSNYVCSITVGLYSTLNYHFYARSDSSAKRISSSYFKKVFAENSFFLVSDCRLFTKKSSSLDSNSYAHLVGVWSSEFFRWVRF